jgi:hypothetical protein
MNATLENPTMSAPGWLVLYAGGYPVRFHRNLCGDVFSLVVRTEATVFATERAAITAAVKAGINQYSVEATR